MKTIADLLKDDKALIAVVTVVVSGFFSVLGIFLGFLLGQVSGFFTARKERKIAVSVALAELLELRYQLFGMESMMEQITGLFGNIPEHEKSQIRLLIIGLLPKWEETHSRYEACVNTIAGLDPLLAFHLRSKDYILQLVNWLHSLMGKDATAASLFGPVLSNILVDSFKPVLDKSILLLARKKSYLCWFRTYRLLRRSTTVTQDAMRLLKPVTANIEALKAAAGAAQSSAQSANQNNPAPHRPLG